MYYLITYVWQSHGRGGTYYNAVIDRHPSDFILERVNDNSSSGEAVLLWAQEITKEQYDKLLEEL